MNAEIGCYLAALFIAAALPVAAVAGYLAGQEPTASVPEAIRAAGLRQDRPVEESWYFVVTKGKNRGAYADGDYVIATGDAPGPGKVVIQRCSIHWDTEPPLGRVVASYCTFKDATPAQIKARAAEIVEALKPTPKPQGVPAEA